MSIVVIGVVPVCSGRNPMPAANKTCRSIQGRLISVTRHVQAADRQGGPPAPHDRSGRWHVLATGSRLSPRNHQRPSLAAPPLWNEVGNLEPHVALWAMRASSDAAGAGSSGPSADAGPFNPGHPPQHGLARPDTEEPSPFFIRFLTGIIRPQVTSSAGSSRGGRGGRQGRHVRQGRRPGVRTQRGLAVRPCCIPVYAADGPARANCWSTGGRGGILAYPSPTSQSEVGSSLSSQGA